MPGDLRELRRRLMNARRRAAYWSGRPSWSRFGFSTRRHNQGSADSCYELAMDDCNALADAIEKLAGRRPAVTDYRDEFQRKFARMMEVRASANGKQ